MKVLLSWLRDFVDVSARPEDIAATMSVRGFAVEGLERLADGDAVIDFEVTGNRPDCMSVSGIAREVATAFGLQVRRPAVSTSLRRAGGQGESGPALHLASLKTVEQGDIDIVIENPELCPRYAGAVVDVTIGPSPEWMQSRLRAAGVRPTSNVVDVTNYVLLELGQPMHAFDQTRIGGGQIRVRTARPGETLLTLDGKQRELSPEMLVIADAERAIAVAGVMGGGDSEVTNDTEDDRLRKRAFQCAVGATNEQGARTEDRSEHALRARHRPAPSGDGHGTRVRAARDGRRRYDARHGGRPLPCSCRADDVEAAAGSHLRASRCVYP